MVTLRRIFLLVFTVAVLIGCSAPILAAEGLDYFVLLPFDTYSFVYYSSDGYSVSEFYDCSSIDSSLPVTIRIGSSVFSGYWFYSENLDLWIFGDFLAGDCFSVRYQHGSLAVYLLGPHSSFPGVKLEIYQGNRNPNVPDPGIGSDSIVDVSVTQMLGYVLGWWSIFWSHLMWGRLSPLFPVLAIAVAVPLVFVVIKLIHKYF